VAAAVLEVLLGLDCATAMEMVLAAKEAEAA
jgi:hypothetical protein